MDLLQYISLEIYTRWKRRFKRNFLRLWIWLQKPNNVISLKQALLLATVNRPLFCTRNNRSQSIKSLKTYVFLRTRLKTKKKKWTSVRRWLGTGITIVQKRPKYFGQVMANLIVRSPTKMLESIFILLQHFIVWSICLFSFVSHTSG